MPEPVLQFPYLRGVCRIERRVHAENGPYWSLSWEGHGLMRLAARPGESLELLRQRALEWVQVHLAEFTYRGVDYQVYQTYVADEIRAREPDAPEAFWHAVSGRGLVLQLPCGRDEPLATVRQAVQDWADEHLFECFGGPLDGQRVGERGELFDMGQSSLPEPDGERPRGRYRRSDRGYEWLAG